MNPPSDYRQKLGFTKPWFTLGLITQKRLQEIGREFEESEDKSPEHWRYGVFRAFLKENRPLSAEMAESLFDLGNADGDYSMGGSMMYDIVLLPECPESVLQKAALSERRSVLLALQKLK